LSHSHTVTLTVNVCGTGVHQMSEDNSLY